jgi:hypothetical protein
MRRVLLASSVLMGLISITVPTFGVICPVPSSATATPLLLSPAGGTCGGGGGGSTGGGGGTPPAGGSLSFGTASNLGLPIGGVSGREAPGVAAATTANQVAYVYTAQNDPDPFELNDQFGDQYVYYGTSGQQPARILGSTGGVFSDANPALLNVSAVGPQVPPLYLAVNSNQNPARNFGGFTGLFVFNGTNWSLSPSQPPSNNFPFTQYSPSLAHSNQYLFLGVTNAADHTVTICRTDITVPSGATSCTNFPGSRAMNFNPGLAYWNGVLYIAFEEFDNNHNLRMFTSTDNGQTIAENTNITVNNVDQSSSAPSLAVFNDALYVGFRSNDGSHQNLYKWSTDGINYTFNTSTGVSSTSGPNFVPITLTPPGAVYLYNYFTTDDSSHNLSLDIAPLP